MVIVMCTGTRKATSTIVERLFSTQRCRWLRNFSYGKTRLDPSAADSPGKSVRIGRRFSLRFGLGILDASIRRGNSKPVYSSYDKHELSELSNRMSNANYSVGNRRGCWLRLEEMTRFDINFRQFFRISSAVVVIRFSTHVNKTLRCLHFRLRVGGALLFRYEMERGNRRVSLPKKKMPTIV